MGFKDARKKRGLSVVQVADALGVSAVAVYQWEAGGYLPAGKRMQQIANLYCCTIDDLLRPDSISDKEG